MKTHQQCSFRQQRLVVAVAVAASTSGLLLLAEGFSLFSVPLPHHLPRPSRSLSSSSSTLLLFQSSQSSSESTAISSTTSTSTSSTSQTSWGRAAAVDLISNDNNVNDNNKASSLFLQKRVVVPSPAARSDIDNVSTTTTTTALTYYQQGLLTIGFCTLVFASMSPVMHAALTMDDTTAATVVVPPVLVLNACVSVVAFLTVLLGGPLLEAVFPGKQQLPPSSSSSSSSSSSTSSSSSSTDVNTSDSSNKDNASSIMMMEFDYSKNAWLLGGLELGLWKFLGTTANLYGLSLTTADHGAFLIQLTTLIVPVVQGLQGVAIPKRIQTAVALALMGVALFTQDHGAAAAAAATDSSSSLLDDTIWQGDVLCVVAAVFYAIYDLRLFQWGKRIAPRPLMVSKIFVQAILSTALLVASTVLVGGGVQEDESIMASLLSLEDIQSWCTPKLIALIAWSGIMVNAVVPFLQVSGQQAIGPVRSQTLYASQPLWASMMSFVWLGETVGWQGWLGGSAFLAALLLAATAQPPSATTTTATTTSMLARKEEASNASATVTTQ